MKTSSWTKFIFGLFLSFFILCFFSKILSQQVYTVILLPHNPLYIQLDFYTVLSIQIFILISAAVLVGLKAIWNWATSEKKEIKDDKDNG